MTEGSPCIFLGILSTTCRLAVKSIESYCSTNCKKIQFNQPAPALSSLTMDKPSENSDARLRDPILSKVLSYITTLTALHDRRMSP
jgi:hypothetical protein